MARAQDHPQEDNRPEQDALHPPVHPERPGEARVRRDDERTPGEDLLGEDLRPADELLAERRPRPDELVVRAELPPDALLPEELDEAREREQARARPRERGRVELPAPDPELIERRAAWEHAPDLERTSNELEAGEGERSSLEVVRTAEQARFDEEANAAYDEAAEEPAEPARPGGRAELEPPPRSVLDVERAEPAAHEGAAPAKKRGRKRKAEGEAPRPRRAARRSRAGDEPKEPKRREADASP